MTMKRQDSLSNTARTPLIKKWLRFMLISQLKIPCVVQLRSLLWLTESLNETEPA